MRILLQLSLLAICLGLGACRRAPADEDLRQFQTAQERFERAETAEEYLLAASLFAQMVEDGTASGAVLFNLGNAYARAGQSGRAVAAYRRAQRYRPRDPYLRNNLDLALGGAPRRSRAGQGILGQMLFWQSWLSLDELAWLLAGIGSLAFLLASGSLWKPQQRLFARFRNLCLLLLAVGLLSYVILDHQQRPDRFGVIVEDGVVARFGPSDSDEPALSEPLPQAAEFEVLEAREHWLRVRMPSGPEVWIPRQAAEVY